MESLLLSTFIINMGCHAHTPIEFELPPAHRLMQLQSHFHVPPLVCVSVVEWDRQSVQRIRRRCRARIQDHGRLHWHPCWYARVYVCTYPVRLNACVYLLMSASPEVHTCVRPSVREEAYAHVLRKYFGRYICTGPYDYVLCHAMSYSNCHALNSNIQCALSNFHDNLNLFSLHLSQNLSQQLFKCSLNPSWTAQNYQVRTYALDFITIPCQILHSV